MAKISYKNFSVWFTFCRVFALLVISTTLTLVFHSVVLAQDPAESLSDSLGPTSTEEFSSPPPKVNVNPTAQDGEIGQRLQSVLNATGWFKDPKVTVTAGVVFLNGETKSAELKNWAGDLARNTQDVAAVANRIEILAPSIWDFRKASEGIFALWRDFLHALPLLALGLIVLVLSIGAGILVTYGALGFFKKYIEANLLRSVLAYTIGSLTFLFGVYIVLRISGLTQLALTVVGGTGLVGLALGIAFRDISENFLASIFLSIQRPFETGDLIEVAGETGFVQQLNVRTTVLMSFNGNFVQIPNASVYKSNLRNFTTNVNLREDFVVGIGYDDSINQAQQIAQSVLREHEAILEHPEPYVLVDSLGGSTVNLRIYFWLNGRKHSSLKVRSSVIRLVKRAFQKNAISMPDEAREVVFPNGVVVTMRNTPGITEDAKLANVDLPEVFARREATSEEIEAASTQAEAGLYSEASDIEKQAQNVLPLRGVENLLPESPAKSSEIK